MNIREIKEIKTNWYNLKKQGKYGEADKLKHLLKEIKLRTKNGTR